VRCWGGKPTRKDIKKEKRRMETSRNTARRNPGEMGCLLSLGGRGTEIKIAKNREEEE